MLIGRFFTDILGVNDMELCQRLMSMTEILVIKKGQKIVNFGEQPEKVTFLIKGIFRGYILNSEGKEITECLDFSREMWQCHAADWISPLLSVFRR